MAYYLAPPGRHERNADLLAHMQALKKGGKALNIRKVEHR